MHALMTRAGDTKKKKTPARQEALKSEVLALSAVPHPLFFL